jgi:predicted Zn-dependent protease
MTSRAVTSIAGSIVVAAAFSIGAPARGQIFTDAESELRVQWLQMKREMPRHPNPAVQRYAECMAWAIIDVIPEEYQDLNWEVIVFDNGATNASVTPEGKIAVFSGLLQVANTPDEFAAVLGHEVAHLTEGHVGERVGRMAQTGLIGIAGAAIGRQAGLPVDAGAVRTGATVVYQYPYQRGQESEADLVGMTYMAKAGYNPAAVLELWKEMSEGRRESDWLSTHPEPQRRMTDMARNLAPALRTYNDVLDSGVRPRCRLGV